MRFGARNPLWLRRGRWRARSLAGRLGLCRWPGALVLTWGACSHGSPVRMGLLVELVLWFQGSPAYSGRRTVRIDNGLHRPAPWTRLPLAIEPN